MISPFLFSTQCNSAIIGWCLNFFPFICFQYLLLAVDLFSIYFQYYLRSCFNSFKLSIDFLLLVFSDDRTRMYKARRTDAYFRGQLDKFIQVAKNHARIEKTPLIPMQTLQKYESIQRHNYN